MKILPYLFSLMLCCVISMNAHAQDYIQLERGKEYFAAISPAKYDYPDYAHGIAVLFEKTGPGKWEKTGHQLLEPNWQTLGLAVIGNKIIFINHNDKKLHVPIAIFDINKFFQKNPTGTIADTPLLALDTINRPTSISSHGKQFVVTHTDEEHGIHIYDLDNILAGNTKPEKEISYTDIDMSGSAPAATLFYKGRLVVSNHYQATISLYDISQTPPAAITIKAGAKNQLYYPLGIALHDDTLFVGDHIHDFINAFDLSDLDNIKLVRSFGGERSALHMPYNLAVYDNTLFVANLLPTQSISAYSLLAQGDATPLYTIEKSPDTLMNAPSDIKFFRYE